MVEGEVVDKWIKLGMLKYSLRLSQDRGWVHECDTISHNFEGELNTLVLYLPQSGTTWHLLQDV